MPYDPGRSEGAAAAWALAHLLIWSVVLRRRWVAHKRVRDTAPAFTTAVRNVESDAHLGKIDLMRGRERDCGRL
jgi:hypothetical protein